MNNCRAARLAITIAWFSPTRMAFGERSTSFWYRSVLLASWRLAHSSFSSATFSCRVRSPTVCSISPVRLRTRRRYPATSRTSEIPVRNMVQLIQRAGWKHEGAGYATISQRWPATKIVRWVRRLPGRSSGRRNRAPLGKTSSGWPGRSRSKIASAILLEDLRPVPWR